MKSKTKMFLGAVMIIGMTATIVGAAVYSYYSNEVVSTMNVGMAQQMTLYQSATGGEGTWTPYPLSFTVLDGGDSVVHYLLTNPNAVTHAKVVLKISCEDISAEDFDEITVKYLGVDYLIHDLGDYSNTGYALFEYETDIPNGQSSAKVDFDYASGAYGIYTISAQILPPVTP